MSEVSKVFGLGKGTSFGNGLSSLDLIITFTDFDRLLIEPIYKDDDLKTDTKVTRFIPIEPGNDIELAKDALLLFAPSLFAGIKSFPELMKITGSEFVEQLGPSWGKIREEAEPVLSRLNLVELEIKPINK